MPPPETTETDVQRGYECQKPRLHHERHVCTDTMSLFPVLLSSTDHGNREGLHSRQGIEKQKQRAAARAKTNQWGGGVDITGVEARVPGGVEDGPRSSGGGSADARAHCSRFLLAELRRSSEIERVRNEQWREGQRVNDDNGGRDRRCVGTGEWSPAFLLRQLGAVQSNPNPNFLEEKERKVMITNRSGRRQATGSDLKFRCGELPATAEN